RFVLKGAMLLTTWLPETARGTRDLDLLGFGDSSEQRILGIFREVLAIAVDDGVDFDLDALQIALIREELEYGAPARHGHPCRRTHRRRRRYRFRRFCRTRTRDDRLSRASRPSD